MFPPEVVIINSTAVRVIWTSPSNPNGVVTEYSVYVNNKRYETGMKTPGSFLLGDLSPFTIYDIQVEVCTVYACVISNGTQITTVEDEPKELSAPQIHVLGPRALQINWASPGQPNGIILGYDLLRKARRQCSVAQQRSKHQSGGACLSLECDINENFCGRQCYNPQFKVCCNGTLHNNIPGFQCCEDQYLHINTSGVCCGGQMHAVQSDYVCCGGYYTRVMTGEVCCPNEENWVSVGIGDSCCQGIPYSVSGNQICCGGLLHDGFNQQCCGGKIVSKDFICCGNKENGKVYQLTSGMFCCGHEYVNMSSTICCTSSSGESKAHIKKNDPAPLKCCETELIPKSEECCNGLGYNPLKYVCSDRISAGMTMKVKEECKASTLCPISMEATAYCGRCDFDKHAHICSWIKSSRDLNLEPHVTYEYRVAVWNKYGKSLSEIGSATTKQDVPEGVSPPHWTKVDNREDIIFLNWEEPHHINGIIIHYIILRNGVERFRGKELSFMDTSGIQPYQEYTYQLRACTVAGCADSSKVVAVTVQGVPESVQPPTVIALSATALHLSWTAPRKPNGIIREYQISQTGKGLIHIDTAGKMQHTVSGLHPHRNYSFTLAACTFVGCTSSQASSSRTLQAPPQGVWSQPRHIIVSSTIVELYWDEPEEPNGIVSVYQLFRNGEKIFNGSERNLNFTDSGLQSNSRYAYQLEASTWGGSNTSDKYIIQTPLTTPEEIPIPYNVTTIDAYSIFVAWDPPGSLKTNVPLKYNVLLNAGSTSSLAKPVGQPTFALLDGLDPYTQYEIRIQACQDVGCGVGKWISAVTDEAPPQDLSPPIITATGSASIEVKWSPPKKPNGRIKNYFVDRRPVGTQKKLLVFIWSEGALEFVDATDVLQPFTAYEYHVRAQNSKGSVDSLWSSTQTLEAPPWGMRAPWAQAVSAYSVLLNWTSPTSPNGPISQYRIVYQERQNDPTFNTPAVTALTVPLKHTSVLVGIIFKEVFFL
ncbi:hypothetical protein JD844_025228 [Phrynosoma platyrhinos]|uniref:Fibronectin type-III domain-containing protein n=1 Tax=Phrynosoma platyrhinos TaxID=52577 RepID=A0ABQ7SZK4_PHRPL|nr:hypothetical protein JD844_025228 [Phrynosoma platyrhinos]